MVVGVTKRVYQLPFLHGVLQTIGRTVKSFLTTTVTS